MSTRIECAANVMLGSLNAASGAGGKRRTMFRPYKCISANSAGHGPALSVESPPPVGLPPRSNARGHERARVEAAAAAVGQAGRGAVVRWHAWLLPICRCFAAIGRSSSHPDRLARLADAASATLPNLAVAAVRAFGGKHGFECTS